MQADYVTKLGTHSVARQDAKDASCNAAINGGGYRATIIGCLCVFVGSGYSNVTSLSLRATEHAILGAIRAANPPRNIPMTKSMP